MCDGKTVSGGRLADFMVAHGCDDNVLCLRLLSDCFGNKMVDFWKKIW